MNKGVLVALVIAILVALGGGAFYMMNKTKTAANVETSNQTSLDSSLEKKSLRDLMTLGNNQQCTFTDTESNSSGIVYVSGGKVRGDFNTTSSAGEMKAHMIASGEEVYVWMDGAADGFKTSVSATESVTSQMESSVDLNKAINYDCTNWSANNSMFQVPTNVTFKDYSSLMENSSGSGSTDTKTMQCQACNSLPSEAAAQCKTALGCN